MSHSTLVRRAVWAGLLALLVTVAYLHASAVTSLVSHALSTTPPRAPSRPLPRDDAADDVHTTSARRVIERNPFDSATGDLSPRQPQPESHTVRASTTSPYTAPECDGVRLVATAVSDDASRSMAMLTTNGRAALLRQGDDVGGKRIWFIRSDRVWLWSADSFCQAHLSAAERRSLPAASASAGPSSAPPAAGQPASEDLRTKIRRISATEVEVDRSVVERLIESQGGSLRSTKLVPEQVNGAVVGHRLFGIRPDSVLGTVGFENGDRLDKINGFELGTPEKALEAYARLRVAERLSIVVNRRGQPTTLEVVVK